MATDYRLCIRCWQEQAGDEDAKINVYLNGTKVVSEATVSGTNPDTDFNIISWESTDLDDIAIENADGTMNDDPLITLKVELVNNLYIDASTDRNVYINGIGYIDKDTDGTYKKWRELASDSSETADFTGTNVETSTTSNIKIDTITDFTDWNNYVIGHIPTEVTSSVIADGWWDTVLATDTFHTIDVWGDETDGVTIKFKIKNSARSVAKISA